MSCPRHPIAFPTTVRSLLFASGPFGATPLLVHVLRFSFWVESMIVFSPPRLPAPPTQVSASPLVPPDLGPLTLVLLKLSRQPPLSEGPGLYHCLFPRVDSLRPCGLLPSQATRVSSLSRHFISYFLVAKRPGGSFSFFSPRPNLIEIQSDCRWLALGRTLLTTFFFWTLYRNVLPSVASMTHYLPLLTPLASPLPNEFLSLKPD